MRGIPMNDKRLLPKSLFITALCLFSFPILGETVELIAETGTQTISFEITSNDTLLEFFQDLQNYTQSNKWQVEIQGDKIIAKSISHPDEPPRDYYNSLSSKDKEDIGFILRTLANTSILKVMSHKAELERAGERVGHVHPFKFLYCIFSDEELKVCIRNLQGKSWVWKDFLGGITSSLEKENAVDNLKSEYIKDFANLLNIDPKVISVPIKKQDWKGVVENLIDKVPREGDTKRYDQ